MPTFFVLSGFFTALLVEKRGTWGTLKNRAARILAPLAAGLVTVLPLTILLPLHFMLAARYGTRDLIPDRNDLDPRVRCTLSPWSASSPSMFLAAAR